MWIANGMCEGDGKEILKQRLLTAKSLKALMKAVLYF